MAKPPNNPTEKLIELLEQFHEGSLSESSRTELNALLRQYPELIDDFIEHREQCASLRIMHLGSHADIPSDLPLFPAAEKSISDGTVLDNSPTSFGLGNLTQFAAPLLALSLIVIAISYTFLKTDSRNGSRPVATAPSPATPLPMVAQLVATNGCKWETLDDTKPIPQVGETLRQGSILELKSGLAQIHYRSGVNLLFQGPGRLELVEPNAVNLHSGVVISRVSPSAIGFTVNTPSSKVIDHGTEFAVGVDSENKTDVSVIEGKVELVNAHNRHDSDARMLTAGQALRIDAEGGIELFRTVDPSRLAENIRESDEVKLHNARVSIYRLHSASSLKLKGSLLRAINVGSEQGIQVGDIYFEPDDSTVLDSPMKLETGWGNLPWLGDSPEDRALCQVLHSIRHNVAEKNWAAEIPNRDRPVSAKLPVTPGRYRIQLLISENFHVQKNFMDRSISLEIEGVPCLRDLRVLASQGIAGHPVPPNQALLIDVEMDVVDGDLHISLFSDEVPENIDPNVILNGLIIERLGEVATHSPNN